MLLMLGFNCVKYKHIGKSGGKLKCRESKEILPKYSPTRKKLKQIQSQRKILAILLRDQKDVLWVEFKDLGVTITSQVYCETRSKLRCTI